MRFVKAVPAPDYGVVTLQELSGGIGVIELCLNGAVIGRFAGNTVTISKNRVDAAGLVLSVIGNGGEGIL